MLQQSASIFTHLKNNVMLSIQQDPTPDLTPDTLGALAALMIAQAQEIFVHKAINDRLKEHVVAKLSAQCEDLYADCLKTFQRDALRQIWDKDWIPIVAGKQAGFHGITQYYQSLVCKANKSVGEEITRLEVCYFCFITNCWFLFICYCSMQLNCLKHLSNVLVDQRFFKIS